MLTLVEKFLALFENRPGTQSFDQLSPYTQKYVNGIVSDFLAHNQPPISRWVPEFQELARKTGLTDDSLEMLIRQLVTNPASRMHPAIA